MFGFSRLPHWHGAGRSHATMCSGRGGTLSRSMSGMSWGLITGRPLDMIGGGGGALSGPYGGPPRRGAGCGRAANVGDAATGGAMAERCVACGAASAAGMADGRVRMVTAGVKADGSFAGGAATGDATTQGSPFGHGGGPFGRGWARMWLVKAALLTVLPSSPG